MKDQPIFIIGFTGVGKTTIGRRLAKELGWEFVDTDEYLQLKYHATVSDMIGCCGIDKFRKRERVILIELAQRRRHVIATGGGVGAKAENLELMKQKGIIIYLEASPRTLAERLALVKESRPAVQGKDFAGVEQYVQATLPQRLPYYQQADITISAEQMVTSEDEERIVADLIRQLRREYSADTL